MKERKFREPLLNRLDRKFGRYAIRNLMLIIVIGTALVWALDYIVWMRAEQSIVSWLWFDKQKILQGEVWRVVTFIFLPQSDSILYLALGLYFDWLIGNALESEWGALRFNLFYLCGILGAILSGFIGGIATNYYLNLSLFLAFAIIIPDFQVLLFFFIPIKVKYLAILDAIMFVLMFIVSGWTGRLVLIMALLNVLLFFGAELFRRIKRFIRRKKYKREARIPKNNHRGNDNPFDDFS